MPSNTGVHAGNRQPIDIEALHAAVAARFPHILAALHRSERDEARTLDRQETQYAGR